MLRTTQADELLTPDPASPAVGEPGTGRRTAGAVELGVAATALALLLWGIGRPAIWLDEAVTVISAQREWPALVRMLGSVDAPLVPFYALTKVTTALVGWLPGSPGPELTLRLPSALAAAAAAGLLVAWLSRRASVPVAVGAAAGLLLTQGFSRYGQEGRPYAAVLLAAVVATVVWDRLGAARDRRATAGWALAYAAAVAAAVLMNTVAVTLVAAHLVASVWTRSGRRAAAGTVAGALVGLAVAAPFTLAAVRNGGGPANPLPVTVDNFVDGVAELFAPAGDRGVVWVVAALAALGALRAGRGAHRWAARVAVAWALVPTALLVLGAQVRPGLMMGRYLLFTVPAWTVLAALGVATLVEGLARLGRGRLPVAAAAAAVCAPLLVAGVVTQAEPLRAVRAPAGHNSDVRPALAFARRPAYADLPIASFVSWPMEVSAYGRDLEERIVGRPVQRTRPTPWPREDPPERFDRLARDEPRLILLMRRPLNDKCRRQWIDQGATVFVQNCMRTHLRGPYRVVDADVSGYRWVGALLERRTLAR